MRITFQRLDYKNVYILILCIIICIVIGFSSMCNTRSIKIQSNDVSSSQVYLRQNKHLNLKVGEYNILPSGSPTIDAYIKMLTNPIYTEWIEVFSDQFVKDNHDVLAKYTLQWADDPLRTWSRGWEYTFVAAVIRKYTPQNRDIFLLDVGSGITFIDWMIAYEILGDNPRSRVIALDNNAAYQDWFHQINQKNAAKAKQGILPAKYLVPKVQFIEHDTQKRIPLANNSIDIAFCISVMEHVDDTITAVQNILDIIVPGGLLIITFDIDINGQIVKHSPTKADTLLTQLRRLSNEIKFNNSVLRTYHNGLFDGDIEKKNDLYTLYEAKKRGFDAAKWIDLKSESSRRGLFFSCHIFQKPI